MSAQPQRILRRPGTRRSAGIPLSADTPSSSASGRRRAMPVGAVGWSTPGLAKHRSSRNWMNCWPLSSAGLENWFPDLRPFRRQRRGSDAASPSGSVQPACRRCTLARCESASTRADCSLLLTSQCCSIEHSKQTQRRKDHGKVRSLWPVGFGSWILLQGIEPPGFTVPGVE